MRFLPKFKLWYQILAQKPHSRLRVSSNCDCYEIGKSLRIRMTQYSTLQYLLVTARFQKHFHCSFSLSNLSNWLQKTLHLENSIVYCFQCRSYCYKSLLLLFSLTKVPLAFELFFVRFLRNVKFTVILKINTPNHTHLAQGVHFYKGLIKKII